MIVENKVNPASANTFLYGRSLEHLSAADVKEFISALASISDITAWIALEILHMYCHGNKERWEECRTTFREIVIKLPLDKGIRKNQHDIYHWHDVVEKLLPAEGADFARAISNIIIDSCSNKLDYGDLWHYVKPLLRKIFQIHGREVWPIFIEAIKKADPIGKYRLSELLSADRDDRKKPSVFAELPDDLLKEWCMQEPDIAPEFVAAATDILTENKERSELSARALFLIDNFGDNASVLSALSANMGSFSWTGSLVPYYRRELAALEVLKNHKKASVRDWVNRRTVYLTKMIEREKLRDEERDWGIY
jgi:hypothetical protein